MEWSDYQRAVFSAVEADEGNLVITARAGGGKTTVIVEACNYVPVYVSTMLCAFNKGIQRELERRAPPNVTVRTLHAVGLGCLSYHLGHPEIDKMKTNKIIRSLVGKDPGPLGTKDGMYRIGRLVGLAKNTLASSEAELTDLAYRHGLEDGQNIPAEDLVEAAEIVLRRCKEDTDTIDFDDMMWLPAELDLDPRYFDVVFVDEAQDLNAAQFWLIERMLREGGRLIAVGDDKQAIYAWRGAGHDVLERLIGQFGAHTLSLPITYRCPVAVVKKAREIVPDFEAAPWAEDGKVEGASIDRCIEEADRGDFILSRLNAPLLHICLQLLRKNKPAVITGKDIGLSLSRLIRKSKAQTNKQLQQWLREYLEKEKRLFEQGYEQRYEQIRDTVYCILALSHGEPTPDAICRRIETLFQDTDNESVITCSTVHKAKGLERDRVWLLEGTFNPHGKGRQEANIYYVAMTRAKKELYQVYS